jgi:hypothetical protein
VTHCTRGASFVGAFFWYITELMPAPSHQAAGASAAGRSSCREPGVRDFGWNIGLRASRRHPCPPGWTRRVPTYRRAKAARRAVPPAFADLFPGDLRALDRIPRVEKDGAAAFSMDRRLVAAKGRYYASLSTPSFCDSRRHGYRAPHIHCRHFASSEACSWPRSTSVRGGIGGADAKRRFEFVAYGLTSAERAKRGRKRSPLEVQRRRR